MCWLSAPPCPAGQCPAAGGDSRHTLPLQMPSQVASYLLLSFLGIGTRMRRFEKVQSYFFSLLVVAWQRRRWKLSAAVVGGDSWASKYGGGSGSSTAQWPMRARDACQGAGGAPDVWLLTLPPSLASPPAPFALSALLTPL